MIEKQLATALEPIVDEVVALKRKLEEVSKQPGPAGVAGSDGKDGRDGKDADPELIAKKLATDYVEVLRGEKGDRGEAGKDGTDGRDGADARPDVVAEVLRKDADFLVSVRGDKGDPGDRGEAGPVGPAGDVGPVGAPGADGIGIESIAVGSKSFDLVLTNGESVEIPLLPGEKGERGDAGQKGDPGIGIKNVDVVGTDSHAHLTFELDDGHEKEFLLVLPKGERGERGDAGKRGVDGAGIETKRFQAGEVYREGSFVTANIGQFFKALRDTVAAPGSDPSWERVGTAGFAWKGLKPEVESLRQGDLYIDNGSLFCCMEDGQLGKMIVQRGQRGEKGDPGRDGKDIDPALLQSIGDEIAIASAKAEQAYEDGLIVKADLDSHRKDVADIIAALAQPDGAVGIRSYRGLFDPNTQYRAGDFVHVGSAVWLAVKEPSSGSLRADEWVKFSGTGAVRTGGSGSGSGGSGGGSGGSGGGQMYGDAAVKAIFYNAQVIAENINVLAGQNGLSAGPITIADGFAVTVADGSVWTVV